MPSLLAFAAPLALLFPLLGQSSGAVLASVAGAGMEAEETSAGPDYDNPSERAPSERVLTQSSVPSGPYSPAASAANPLDVLRGGQIVRQVRIEQRVIVRISPQRSSGTRNNLLAELPERGLSTRYQEQEMERCLPVSRIAGVQTGNGNRLILFLHDDRIISINLERACRARDFYSGFYVEQNADGQLCVDRDALQSRSGAKCEVERMRQLVAITD